MTTDALNPHEILARQAKVSRIVGELAVNHQHDLDYVVGMAQMIREVAVDGKPSELSAWYAITCPGSIDRQISTETWIGVANRLDEVAAWLVR